MTVKRYRKMKLIRICFIVFVSFFIYRNTVFAQQGIAQLRADYISEQISLREYAVTIGYAVFYPDRLNPQYRSSGDVSISCGTEAVNLLKSNYGLLTLEEQELFNQFLFRPSPAQLPETYISPEGLFKIHYTTAGANAVLEGDDNTNGIPDFVEQAGISLDRSYDFYIESGYKLAPSDNVDGNEYDAYLLELGGGTYGFTSAETDQQGTPWFDPSSYITMSSTFQDVNLFTNGTDAIKVTSAHEFHHAVQFSYIFRASDIFFYEMTSTLFEDVLYDEVNDYLQYLPHVLGEDNMENSLWREFPINGTLRQYGMSIFLHFINKKFGPDLLVKMWENMHLQSAMQTIEKVVNEETESSFEAELQEFYVWNYFTGTRADTLNYYSEGNLYPDLVFNEVIEDFNDTSLVIINRHLSAQYYAFRRPLSGTFQVNLDGLAEDSDFWSASLVLNDDFNQPKVQQVTFTNGISGTASIFSFGSSPELVLILSNSSQLPKSGQYQMNVSITITEPSAIANSLLPTIPSPANFTIIDKIKIPFEIGEPDEVELRIYSLSGMLVKRFPKVSLTPAKYEHSTPFVWDGNSDDNQRVPSGIYIYILKGDNFIKREKMAVIR